MKFIEIFNNFSIAKNPLVPQIVETFIDYFELEGHFVSVNKTKKEKKNENGDNVDFVFEEFENEVQDVYKTQIYQPFQRCEKKLGEMLKEIGIGVSKDKNLFQNRFDVPKETPEGHVEDTTHWFPKGLVDFFENSFKEIKIQENESELPECWNEYRNLFIMALDSYNTKLSYESRNEDGWMTNAKEESKTVKIQLDKLIMSQKSLDRNTLEKGKTPFSENFNTRRVISGSQVTHMEILKFSNFNSDILFPIPLWYFDQNNHSPFNSFLFSINLVVFGNSNYSQLLSYSNFLKPNDLFEKIDQFCEKISQTLFIYNEKAEVIKQYTNISNELNHPISILFIEDTQIFHPIFKISLEKDFNKNNILLVKEKKQNKIKNLPTKENRKISTPTKIVNKNKIDKKRKKNQIRNSLTPKKLCFEYTLGSTINFRYSFDSFYKGLQDVLGKQYPFSYYNKYINDLIIISEKNADLTIINIDETSFFGDDFKKLINPKGWINSNVKFLIIYILISNAFF